MEPRRNEHTIGSSVSDNFKPREDRGMAFSHAEAPSEETARSRALSSSSGALLIKFWSFCLQIGVSHSFWKIWLWGNSETPSFCFQS